MHSSEWWAGSPAEHEGGFPLVLLNVLPELMKRAVIFDVGGVLCSPPQIAIAAYENQLRLPRGAIGRVFSAGAPANAFCRLEKGHITLSQFIPEFEKECFDAWRDKGVEPIHGMSAHELFQLISTSITPHMQIIHAAHYLKQIGYKTCALTNNWIDDIGFQGSLFHELQLTDYFNVVVESCKVGLRKPDQSIYQLACRLLEVEPHQAVFLDDLGVNLKAARTLGMDTIKVNNEEQALRDLSQQLHVDLLTITHKSKL